jgi:hypothetical protein
VRLLQCGSGGNGAADSAALASAFSAVVAFPESRDVATAFVATFHAAVRRHLVVLVNVCL